jgi:small subunit ribosomal protein S13
MVYTYKDVDFSDKRGLRVSLKRISGIGFSRADYICSLVGLSKNCRTGYLNYYLFSVVVFLLKQYYGTDVFLKRMRENRLKEFLAFKSYKSIRFAAGLPIRGQRTHTNAQTVKRSHGTARKTRR